MYKTKRFQDLEKVSTSKEDMQFKFATSIWETRHNKKFTGGTEETKEVCNMVNELTELMRTK